MKYRIVQDHTKEITTKDGVVHTLHQIQRISDGEYGGFIESENNLSQDGNCWVGLGSMVYGKAKVYNNAQILGCAFIYAADDSVLKIADAAVIDAKRDRIFIETDPGECLSIKNRAMVIGNVRIDHNVHIASDVFIHGSNPDKSLNISGPEGNVLTACWIDHHAIITGQAQLQGIMDISEWTMVGNDVRIEQNTIVSGQAVLLSGTFKETSIKNALFIAGHGSSNAVIVGNIVVDEARYDINNRTLENYKGLYVNYEGTKLYSLPKLIQLLENTGNQKYTDTILLRMDPKRFIEPENEIAEDNRDLL